MSNTWSICITYDNVLGNHGTVIKCQANYFKLMTRPNWILYQYRVDVSPEEEQTHVRRNLMRVHKDKIGGHIFDGTVLYTPHKLNPDPLLLYSKRDDGVNVTLSLKLVGDVTPGDYVYLQVFNILMRRCYSSLKLQLMNRDFFDENAKVNVENIYKHIVFINLFQLFLLDRYQRVQLAGLARVPYNDSTA